ncbi:MAG: hypothetical protein AAFO63_04630 [Pseudomonadota bacterium]
MIKSVISAVIIAVFIVIGGVGGHFLKTGGGGSESSAELSSGTDEKADKKDSYGKDDKGQKKDDGHGGKGDKDEYGGSAPGDVYYFEFSREFVVPILREGRVESLVIIQLNLEADLELSRNLFTMEPKLRDNIMSTLIALSNDGDTLTNLTDVEHYETIRAMVLMNLEDVVAEGLHNVLILDIAKQDL